MAEQPAIRAGWERISRAIRRYLRKEPAAPKAVGRAIRVSFFFVPLTIVMAGAFLIWSDDRLPCSRYVVNFKNQSDRPVTDIILKTATKTLWQGELRPGQEHEMTFEMHSYPEFTLSAEDGGRKLSAPANKMGIRTDAGIRFNFSNAGLAVDERELEKTFTRSLKDKSPLVFMTCPT